MPASISRSVGLTFVITPTPRDAAGNPLSLTGRTVTHVSSNESVAPVTASGVGTARAVGTATITTTVDGVADTTTVTVTPQDFGAQVPANAASVKRPPSLKSRDVQTLQAVYFALGQAAPSETRAQLGARIIQHRINPDALYGWTSVDRWLDVDTQATGSAAIAAGCTAFTKLQYGAFRRALRDSRYTVANGPNFGAAAFASIQLHPLLHSMVPSFTETLAKEYFFDDYGDEWTGAVPARTELSSNPAVGYMDTVALNSQLRTTATEGTANISVQRGAIVSNTLVLTNELKLFTPADLKAAVPGPSVQWDRRIGRTVDAATSRVTQWDSCDGAVIPLVGGKNEVTPLNNCPTWDPLLSRIVFDATRFGGTYFQTALSTTFDFVGAYTLVLIGALTTSAALRYAAVLTNAGLGSYLAVEQTAANLMAGEGGGQQLVSAGTVVTGTRRVFIISKDAGTNYAFDAPDKPRITATGTAAPTGGVPRVLTVGGLVAPGGNPSPNTSVSGCIDYIGAWPRQITPAETVFVRRFAVNAHLGVAT